MAIWRELATDLSVMTSYISAAYDRSDRAAALIEMLGDEHPAKEPWKLAQAKGNLASVLSTLTTLSKAVEPCIAAPPDEIPIVLDPIEMKDWSDSKLTLENPWVSLEEIEKLRSFLEKEVGKLETALQEASAHCDSLTALFDHLEMSGFANTTVFSHTRQQLEQLLNLLKSINTVPHPLDLISRKSVFKAFEQLSNQ